MKVRTSENLSDEIDRIVGWRMKELAAIKLRVLAEKDKDETIVVRASVPLLYAHWEGIVKEIAKKYLEFVSNQEKKYGELKPNFLTLSIRENLKKAGEANKHELKTNLIISVLTSKDRVSSLPYKNIIDTRSNLNSEVFTEIMNVIGLDYKSYEMDFNTIDKILVNYRNRIAHGERVGDVDLNVGWYCDLHEKTLKIIDEFKEQIRSAAIEGLYLEDITNDTQESL